MIRRFIFCLTASSFIILFSGNTTSVLAQTTKTMNEKEHLVGADQDEHGCKPSAGYTWSIIQHQCVRIWEVGIRLDPVPWDWPKNAGIGPVRLPAFLIFSKDQRKVELFIPGEPATILNRRNLKVGYCWTNRQNLTLTQQADDRYMLKESDKLIYSTLEIEK